MWDDTEEPEQDMDIRMLCRYVLIGCCVPKSILGIYGLSQKYKSNKRDLHVFESTYLKLN